MPQLGSRKSRKGCRRCKQRRVKCDEQVPCGTCVRRNEECSFLAIIPDCSSGTSADPALPSDHASWLSDMELMYHYLTVLSSFGAPEKVVHLWQHYIPQQALKHSFLMHGLLAFTALHLAYLRPDDGFKYLQLCDRHQAFALQKFRSVLSSPVDPKLADATFALAATLALSSMARSCAVSEVATMDIEAITELFILTRGIANVLRLSSKHIRQGPLAIMLEDYGYPKGTIVDLPESVSSRFEAMKRMLISSDLDHKSLKHCQFALTELEEIYRNIAYLSPAMEVNTGTTSRWQVAVPFEYVRLVQQRNPPALIILAYYAATITAIRRAWYTQNWADYALRAISQALDDDMQHWLDWPMQQVQDRMKDLGVEFSGEKDSPVDTLAGV